MAEIPIPKGDPSREAIDALRGYVYQIYQSALAWIELESEELLFLEVAEDYAVAANDALKAVQVKETKHNVTINSDDIVASIDSFVELRQKNPELKVKLRHLTTSKIGKEQSAQYRIGDESTLESWRRLAKTGDVTPLREILGASKLSKKSKRYIQELSDLGFREEFLKRIHFDCGALESTYLVRQLRSRLLELVKKNGGMSTQADNLFDNILVTLFQKATQKQKDTRFVDRIILEELLEKATRISVNRTQFERQSQLLNEALSTSVLQDKGLAIARLLKLKPIDDVPFPKAIANRTTQIDNIVSSLTQYGVSWIFGAAGVGKTLGAKIAALRLGGNWGIISLRGLKAEQVEQVLSDIIDILAIQEIAGLLVDDLECPYESNVTDTLLYLLSVCNRSDILIIFTSPRRPSLEDFLYYADLPISIGERFAEFSKQDIREILIALNVDTNLKAWVAYIHVVSGGGHPQLTIAVIQNMKNNGWDVKELATLDSLLGKNAVVEQVRSKTRERLLRELPENSRRLIERLSLRLGGFKRNFVLDMAQITPEIVDGGILFEKFIGSWVDQQEGDKFSLSPLLNNLADNTLTNEQKEKVNFEIANSIIKERQIDPIEANSALFAARSGKNTQVIIHLCMSLLQLNKDDLEIIAPHLMILTYMRTDIFAYEDNPSASQIFRGAQLLLACHEKTRRKEISNILDCFIRESDRVEDELPRDYMILIVYSKLLLAETRYGALSEFWNLVLRLDELLEKQGEHLPLELVDIGMPLVGFMFLNQARQIKSINDLLPAFEFINLSKMELRQRLLKPYDSPDIDIDTLVSGAWLSEHDEGTIDPSTHAEVFIQLEESAKSWDHIELAVCCRKYRVIIIDEYGKDKDQALAVLDEGLKLYGETNSELIRAKAKVLYRAEDHQGSLKLSEVLIEGNAPLSETEKAFLGRDAAISAEKQHDYERARKYFLYGSDAAGNCDITDMIVMQVGLMADAALASWHAGDRETCIHDFIEVLHRLKNIDSESSLCATHCHAICRHVLLWLDQDTTGEEHLLPDGEELNLYPGIVSNPEPSQEMRGRHITPLDMAWYLLASIENNSFLDVGINQNLETFLPKGSVFEGQLLLLSSKMRKAFALCNTTLIVEALREEISIYSYSKDKGENSFDINSVTYGSLPTPTVEQQEAFFDFTEKRVLSFVSNCIFTRSTGQLNQFIISLKEEQGFKVRKEFLNCLRGDNSTTDYICSIATLLAQHLYAIDNNKILSPMLIFELGFKMLQVAIDVRSIKNIAESEFKWVQKNWILFLQEHYLMLSDPHLHAESITGVQILEGDSPMNKLIELLLVILPTLGDPNEGQLRTMLNDMRKPSN